MKAESNKCFMCMDCSLITSRLYASTGDETLSNFFPAKDDFFTFNDDDDDVDDEGEKKHQHPKK